MSAYFTQTAAEYFEDEGYLKPRQLVKEAMEQSNQDGLLSPCACLSFLLRDHLEMCAPKSTDWAHVYSDLLMSALQQVDYFHIAHKMLEDYEETDAMMRGDE